MTDCEARQVVGVGGCSVFCVAFYFENWGK